MIEFSHVGVTFKPQTPVEKQALIDLNLKINSGSFVTVVGSNGAGKSTLLSVLAGATLPTTGKVIINGQNISRQSVSERVGKVACVFQDLSMGSCDSLTIEENLALAALRGSRRGLRSALNHQKRQFFRDEIAKLGIGLEAYIHNPMDSLSGGNAKRFVL